MFEKVSVGELHKITRDGEILKELRELLGTVYFRGTRIGALRGILLSRLDLFTEEQHRQLSDFVAVLFEAHSKYEKAVADQSCIDKTAVFNFLENEVEKALEDIIGEVTFGTRICKPKKDLEYVKFNGTNQKEIDAFVWGTVVLNYNPDNLAVPSYIVKMCNTSFYLKAHEFRASFAEVLGT